MIPSPRTSPGDSPSLGGGGKPEVSRGRRDRHDPLAAGRPDARRPVREAEPAGGAGAGRDREPVPPAGAAQGRLRPCAPLRRGRREPPRHGRAREHLRRRGSIIVVAR